MFYLLIVIILIVALLMGISVLLQSGKGGGLAGIASGGQTTQILGARQAPDFLEKATWSLGWLFLGLCLVTTFFIPRASRDGSILQDRAGELPAAAPSAIEAPIEGDAAPAPSTANPATPTAPDVPPTQE
ncbi:preprotein translocase subunit SecG [Rubrivirga sp. IMCC43871]|uniref:preprotein translocase subunit SecG n=1 Tax=Rubrivirga sp. IMCC43871 TaxID=3391575 RepID=UPI00398FC06A